MKATDVRPAGTVTLAGTDAIDGLELASVTTVPPAGAARESVTVPTELPPPVTVDGLSLTDDSAGSGAGVTVTVAVRPAPL